MAPHPGNNTTQNNVIDTDAEVEETIGTVLNNQNQTVNKLIEKIILPIIILTQAKI